MTDQEMFEFAAKAAGKKIEYWHSNGSPMCRSEDGTLHAWKPRDDILHSENLTRKCGIYYGIGSDTNRPRVAWFIRGLLQVRNMPENKHPDIAIYDREENWMCYAIFSAAVEIGQAMP